MRHRLENTPAATYRPLDNFSVNQVKHKGRALAQRSNRPEFGAGENIFEMQATVTDGFIEECQAMFVVSMSIVVSNSAHPVTRQFVNK